MTDTFEAKVNNMDCQITIDDDYHITKITTNNGRWLVTLSQEDIDKLEDQYDYLIEDIRRDNDRDIAEYRRHLHEESDMTRFV